MPFNVFNINPVTDKEYIVCGDNYRISILTDRLLRLEYSPDGEFEDRATRFAFNRNFDTPKYSVYRENGRLHIVTKHLHLKYDEKPFSAFGLGIIVDGNKDWYYTLHAENLGGTVRTLDNVSGAIKLDDGILSRNTGFYAYDDSKTLAIGEDGWPVPLFKNGRTDIYFFGYNRAYEQCIKDFYKLTSPVPLLPRFALGNWWSRYHKYSDKEYLALMDKFADKKIPLSVSVIDMDWHITATPDAVKYGDGWTGYTWNRELFPDYKAFLSELKSRKLAITLNLHPKDGIRAFEEVYPVMAKKLGIDPKSEKQIEFDASNRKFTEEYFNCVLNPYEKDGVDFWWIDWQQRGGSSVEGYDALWMQNHCHYVDNAKDGHRPLILSRYAGVGSHRYPLGFSGDTHVTWEALAFQPYFTSTAANVGYSWWSHDIGGHMCGIRDTELHTRWVQLGVFSPIMRLHSSPSDFTSKEPWNYGIVSEAIVTDFMRLRKKMIPYTFSMMYRNTEDGIPMIRPMYHKYPFDGGAFAYKNEYLFGDELIVLPITERCEEESRLAKATGWLPKGKHVDIFTGRIYNGDRTLNFYRPLDKMPVLAPAGAIIPFDTDDTSNGAENPSSIELYIVGGADGSFTMTEDNGKCFERCVTTRTSYSFTYGRTSVLAFTAVSGENVPSERDYRIRLAAFTKPNLITCKNGNGTRSIDFSYDDIKNEVCAHIGNVKAGDSVEITIETDGNLPKNDIKNAVFELLMNARYSIQMKDALNYIVNNSSLSASEKIAFMMTKDVNSYILGGITEILSAN